MSIPSPPQLHDPSQPPPAPGRTAGGPENPNLLFQEAQDKGTPGEQGRNAFNSERPLGVIPTPEGRALCCPLSTVKDANSL